MIAQHSISYKILVPRNNCKFHRTFLNYALKKLEFKMISLKISTNGFNYFMCHHDNKKTRIIIYLGQFKIQISLWGKIHDQFTIYLKFEYLTYDLFVRLHSNLNNSTQINAFSRCSIFKIRIICIFKKKLLIEFRRYMPFKI